MKGAKEPSKQSTLFGLPLGQVPEKKSGRKKKDTSEGEISQTVTTPDAVPASSSSMPSSDITMADAFSDATLVETQLNDEPFEKETQTAETAETETQHIDSPDDSMNTVRPLSPVIAAY